MPRESFPEPWEKIDQEKDETIERLKNEKEALMNLVTRQNENLHEQYERGELAGYDHLTGILNRRGFEDEFKDHFPKPVSPADQRSSSSAEKPPGPMALLVADVDNFKSINDTYGHEIGDAVLKAVAEKLKGLSRDEDIVGRYGGEEFVVAFLDTVPEEMIKRFPKEKKGGSEEDTEHEGELSFTIEIPSLKDYAPPISLEVTLSGGLIDIQPGNSSSENALQLLQKAYKSADGLLYAAKRNGKNKVLMRKPQPEIKTL